MHQCFLSRSRFTRLLDTCLWKGQSMLGDCQCSYTCTKSFSNAIFDFLRQFYFQNCVKNVDIAHKTFSVWVWGAVVLNVFVCCLEGGMNHIGAKNRRPAERKRHRTTMINIIEPFPNTSAAARLRLEVPHVSTKPLKSSLSLHAKILFYI